jgi:hypothetical protein
MATSNRDAAIEDDAIIKMGQSDPVDHLALTTENAVPDASHAQKSTVNIATATRALGL